MNVFRALAALALLSPAVAAPEVSDLQALVDAAATSGAKSVTIPAGTYRVAPPGHGRWAHLNLGNLTNFTVKAKGVTMLCTRDAVALELSGCSNVSVIGLTVDFDPMIFTQGVVTEWAQDGGWFEVKLDAGYPQAPDTKYARMDVYDAKTLRLKPDCWTIVCEKENRIAVIEPGLVRVPWRDTKSRNNIAPGDLVALCEGGAHAVSIAGSSRCTLRDVTIHGARCFGLIEWEGDANRYERLRIIPGPKPAGATRARIRSTCADGFHSKRARTGPVLEDCRIECTGDDAIAINGRYVPVLRASGRELVLADQVRAGDRIRVVSAAVEVRGEAVVTNAVRITDERQRQELVAAWPAGRDERHPPKFDVLCAVQVDADLSPAAGDRVSFPEHNGAGFAIRDTAVFNNRARGMLVKAGPGLIEDNTVDGSAICGIILCPEFYWNEACFSRDVVIRNNQVRNTGLGPANWGSLQAGAITVAADSTDGRIPAAGGHRNIRIEKNTIEGCPGPCIEVTSAEGVVILGNTFTRTHGVERNNGGRFHIATDAAIWLDNVSDVTVANNKVSGLGGFGRRFGVATERVEGLKGSDAGRFTR